MSTWNDLLFGSLAGFSALMIILFMVLMGVFFVVSFFKLTNNAPEEQQPESRTSTSQPDERRDAA